MNAPRPLRIGLVTCARLPEPDPDAAPLDDALRRRGHQPTWVAWDDGAVDVAGLDLLVMRSAWNYYTAPSAFLEWTASAHHRTPLINRPAVIAWNAHKGYLATLAAAGVAVVPTRVLTVDEVDALDLDGDVVIKPAIGAGSFGTRRFAGDDPEGALAHAHGLGGQVIVQPYVPGFVEPGERALIYIAGAWTHAVLKHPRFADDVERVDGAAPPTPAELEVARAALDVLPWPVSYARVDLVIHDGRPVLSELELIEPSLFFAHGAGSVERFVDMIEGHAG